MTVAGHIGLMFAASKLFTFQKTISTPGGQQQPLMYRLRVDGDLFEISAFCVYSESPAWAVGENAMQHVESEQDYRGRLLIWVGFNEILFPDYHQERPFFNSREKQVGPFGWASSVDRTTPYRNFFTRIDRPVFRMTFSIATLEELSQASTSGGVLQLAASAAS